MAKTLWPMGSIVCFEGFEAIPYRLLDRVVVGHTKHIPILDILTLKIEWTVLSDLRYLDKPEKFKEYYYAIQRRNTKKLRKSQRTTIINRKRSSEESERKQGRRLQSPTITPIS